MMKLVRHPRGGLQVKGWINGEEWKKLEDLVRDGKFLVFGYYADIWLEWSDGMFRTTNTATGTVLYEGKNFKDAYFKGYFAGKRYDVLDDKYFHSPMERAFVRGW